MKLCGFEAGLDKPLFLIAGPCVIESREFAIETAGKLKEIAARVGIPSFTNHLTTKPIVARLRLFAVLG
jgi:3-deoxy-D-manno-octulosonic acid (KDO) 8-phosphate synthase